MALPALLAVCFVSLAHLARGDVVLLGRDAQAIVDALHAVGRLGDRDSAGLAGGSRHGAHQRDHARLGLDIDVAVLEHVLGNELRVHLHRDPRIGDRVARLVGRFLGLLLDLMRLRTVPSAWPWLARWRIAGASASAVTTTAAPASARPVRISRMTKLMMLTSFTRPVAKRVPSRSGDASSSGRRLWR